MAASFHDAKIDQFCGLLNTHEKLPSKKKRKNISSLSSFKDLLKIYSLMAKWAEFERVENCLHRLTLWWSSSLMNMEENEIYFLEKTQEKEERVNTPFFWLHQTFPSKSIPHAYTKLCGWPPFDVPTSKNVLPNVAQVRYFFWHETYFLSSVFVPPLMYTLTDRSACWNEPKRREWCTHTKYTTGISHIFFVERKTTKSISLNIFQGLHFVISLSLFKHRNFYINIFFHLNKEIILYPLLRSH